jgi:hypothetical protein
VDQLNGMQQKYDDFRFEAKAGRRHREMEKLNSIE